MAGTKNSLTVAKVARRFASFANTAIIALVSRSALPLIEIDLFASLLDRRLNELQVVRTDVRLALNDG